MQFRIFLVATTFLVAGLSSAAQTQLIPTEADFALIYDHETETVLYSKQGEEPMVPASMTKIMTVQIAFERLATGELQLTDRIEVSENAWRQGGARSGGSTMFLEPKDEPTVEELLRGIMILSGNDACIALAEGISGSEEAFIAEMNDVAAQIGLTSANFTNVTGLFNEEHLISAADLAELTSRQINQFPELYALYSEPEYEWRGIKQPNRNPLLGSIEGADGVKTGHLSVSGYGLVGSAKRGDTRRIIVLNGLESQADRRREAQRLMNSAFNAFETRSAEANTVVGELEVLLGTETSVPVALKDSVKSILHKRSASKMETVIVQEGPLKAPISAGDEVATLVITVEDDEIVRTPLIATEDVPSLGFFGRVIAGLGVLIGE